MICKKRKKEWNLKMNFAYHFWKEFNEIKCLMYIVVNLNLKISDERERCHEFPS